MGIVVVANAAMQPWVDDAQRFPRGVPAALRTMLDSGYVRESDSLYFAAMRSQVAGDVESMFATPVEREGFINKLRLDGLKPTMRLADTTPEWAYECVAIGMALGARVLEQHDVFVTVSLDFGEEVEYPSSTFRFTSEDWAGQLDNFADAVLVMRRG